MSAMLTVIGQLVAPEGLVHSADALGRVDEVAWVPPAVYVRDQPADLPIYFAHDRTWRLGTIGALERSDKFGLMAVGTIDADVDDLLADGPWYFSDSITYRRRGQYGDAAML